MKQLEPGARMRFSTIGHHDHVYLNPIGAEKMDRLLALARLPERPRVLDVGCGKGELLVRAAEMHGATGVGVDVNPEFLAEARRRASARAPGADLVFHEADAAHWPIEEGAFDLAACVGSSHACGGYREALRTLRRAVRPGGLILMGEGYWRWEPSREYLAAIGVARDELTDHVGNVSRALREELTPLYAAASSLDEWDHYEGLYSNALERHLAEHPDDPDHEAMAARIRGWREAYLTWGRETLGFGLYLFRSGRR